VNRFGGVVAGFVYVDQAERTLEEFLDVLFADHARGEEFVEIEVGEAAIGDAGWKLFDQEFAVDRAQGADFLEEDALNRVEELVGIDEAAELDAGNRFDENGAEKAEKVAFRGDVFAGVGDSVGHF